jgi:hypothetical protein
MTTYELTEGTREEFGKVQTQLISDFAQQVTGADVTNQLLGHGKVVSCLSPSDNFESIIFTVKFDLDETKHYGAAAAIATGGLKFADESVLELWNSFNEAYNNLKSQLYTAVDEARRREKEEAKKADRLKKAEANYERLKEKSLRDFEELTQRAKQAVTQTDEFYYALGWLAANAKTVSAVLPDYLESAFVKYFGEDVPHRVVDSKKRSPAGWQQQWSWAFKISLKRPEAIPSMLNQYVGATGKEIAKTSFIWDLVSDYGFKFGKKQDTLDIMRCIPIEYVPMFNAGFQA